MNAACQVRASVSPTPSLLLDAGVRWVYQPPLHRLRATLEALHSHFPHFGQLCLNGGIRGWSLAMVDPGEGRYAEILAAPWAIYPLLRKAAAQIHLWAHDRLLGVGWRYGAGCHRTVPVYLNGAIY